jgi:hypothetical protein
MSRFDKNLYANVGKIELCGSSASGYGGWASSIQVWGGEDAPGKTSGVIGTKTSRCKTVKLDLGDCITKVYSYAGAYTEYIRVSTI